MLDLFRLGAPSESCTVVYCPDVDLALVRARRKHPGVGRAIPCERGQSANTGDGSLDAVQLRRRVAVPDIDVVDCVSRDGPVRGGRA